MGRRIISFRYILVLIIISISGIGSSSLQALERQREVLYFNSFNTDNARSKDNFIANAVFNRIEEAGVAVQQMNIELNATTVTETDLELETVCSHTSAMGCIWISELKEGFSVHLVFFDSQNVWKMHRYVDSREMAVLAESTAMVVKSAIEGMLKQSEITSSDPPPRVDPIWNEEDEEPIPAARPASESTRFLFPLSLSGGYSIALMASEIEPSQGIESELAYWLTEKLSAFASYTGNWLSFLKDNKGRLKVRLHPVHLGLRHVYIKGCIAFAFGAAVGFIPVESNRQSGVFSTKDKQIDFHWSIVPGFRISVRLTNWLGLYFGATADIFIPSYSYTATNVDGERTRLKAWLAMPRFQTGFTFGQTEQQVNDEQYTI